MLAFSIALAACNGRCGKETGPVEPAAPFRLGPIAAPHAVASPAAFDLVATGDGAVLFFAAPESQGGVLRAVSLDPRGATRGRETVVADRAASATPLQVSEVAAASAGGRLGVAWITNEANVQTEVHATFGGAEALAFAPAMSLGNSAAIAPGARGRLAMSASEDGVLTLTYRKADGTCESESGSCARYQHRRIGRPEAAARGSENNEVRVPCEPLLPGSVWTAGVWFTGVCSAVDGARSHVFAIRQEPSYAAVYDGPQGCLPVGVVALADGAASVTACAEGRQVARLASDGRASESITQATFTTVCAGGHAELRATGESRTIVHPLSAPQSRVEAMLPPSIALPGSRAVWTGEALLVASPQGGDLFLRRYACHDDAPDLARDDDGP